MRLLVYHQPLIIFALLFREFQAGDASIVTAATFVSPQVAATTASASIGTCESRTINYITHGSVLPSICLKHSRLSLCGLSASGTTVNLPCSTTKAIENDNGSLFITSVTPAASAGLSADAVITKKENDDAGPLDESSFLSFEDWKKQRLEKEGLIDFALEEQRPQTLKDRDRSRRPGGISEDLEALGDEDGELQTDFSAFINNHGDAAVSSRTQDDYPSGKPAAGGNMKDEKQRHRNKDAGKTCKERFNFASNDAGSQVMKTNSEAKSASALLSENRDIYMLNICHAKNKFLIIELSELILVETVAIANFEFFSSTFRQFRISVSDRYPVELDQWIELGIFEAKNSRDIQAFLIEDSRIWARYLQVEFLSHYGNEFYCPVSLLRVHGRTMIQDIQDTLSMEQSSDLKGNEGGELRSLNPENAARNSQEVSEKPEENESGNTSPRSDLTINSTNATSPWIKSELIIYSIFDRSLSTEFCFISESSTAFRTTQGKLLSDAITSNCVTRQAQPGTSDVYCPPPIPTTTESAASTIDPLIQSRMQNASTIESGLRTTIPSLGPTFIENIGASGTLRSSVVSTAHVSQPTTQESFFKSISKRLQHLEANSTLSLKYIEEQSRILRDAFTKVEKRQLSKTTSFLENLNDTVVEELRKFSRQYEQIWQSTVIELETQRDQSQREITAVSARLNILADELVFQKRMSIIQSILLLVCLGLVIFSRGLAVLDIPIVPRSRSASRAPRHGFVHSSTIQRGDTFHSGSWLNSRHGRDKSDESILSMRYEGQSTPSFLQLSDESEKENYETRDACGDHLPSQTQAILTRSNYGSENGNDVSDGTIENENHNQHIWIYQGKEAYRELDGSGSRKLP